VTGAVVFANTATGRCLVPGAAQGMNNTVVLLPCNSSDVAQAWEYGKGGAQTVSALIHSASGLALYAGNGTLFSAQQNSYDQAALPDAAYGVSSLFLGPYYPTQDCKSRGCEGYFPQQLWYGPDAVDGFIAQATYTASINHCTSGDCYVLTSRSPTYQHHCLAHVLSVRNEPSDSGLETEVWGGPLDGGAYVLGLLNLANTNTTISAPFSALGVSGVNSESTFCVRSLWAPAKTLGVFTGSIALPVPSNDLAVLKLSPGGC